MLAVKKTILFYFVYFLIMSVIPLRSQDCCTVPFKVQNSGRLEECSAYFAQQNCPIALCAQCTENDTMFVADPNCFYPC